MREAGEKEGHYELEEFDERSSCRQSIEDDGSLQLHKNQISDKHRSQISKLDKTVEKSKLATKSTSHFLEIAMKQCKGMKGAGAHTYSCGWTL